MRRQMYYGAIISSGVIVWKHYSLTGYNYSPFITIRNDFRGGTYVYSKMKFYSYRYIVSISGKLFPYHIL